MNRSSWRYGALVLALAVVAGCSIDRQWQPAPPMASVGVNEFSERYLAVLNAVADSTADGGLVWETGTVGPTLETKLGICSWSLSRSGTWAGDEDGVRSLRNKVNRALIRNGFHAARWNGREDDDLLLTSQDARGALLEISLEQPATIAIYSPAAGAPECPPN